MGLSASQARLLNLTARMHDIEYKAQNLEAQKLQMANESTQVYKEYEDALNKQKVQFKRIASDGSAAYEDASIQTLLDAGYKIKISNGSDWFDFRKVGAAATKTFGNFEATPTAVTITAGQLAGNAEGDEVTVDDKLYKLAETPTDTATSVQAYEFIGTTGATATNFEVIDFSSTEVLRNMVEAGFIVFEKPQADGTFAEVNIATDTSLQEVSNEVDLKKAEAKYEADIRKINAKDKKFDTDIAAMETERNAIKTEMDTLKSVAKDNVDRTFKLFS